MMERIRSLFSGAGKSGAGQAAGEKKGFDPLKTTWILDRIRVPDADESKLLKPLPLIGHWSSRQQMALLLLLVLVSGIAFVVVALLSFRASNLNAERRSIATEMQMLSQRLARASTQSVQGIPAAFPVLRDSYEKFGLNLEQLQSSRGFFSMSVGVTDELDKINATWSTNFKPGAQPPRPNVQTILEQQKSLEAVGKAVEGINANDTNLLEQIQQFSGSLAENGATQRELEAAGQLGMLSQRMAKNANATLASELINPDVVFLLGKDVATFKDIVDGFLQGNDELGLRPVSSSALVAELNGIKTSFADFEKVVTSFSKNMKPLVDTRKANQSIVKESDALLLATQNLAAAYENRTANLITSVLEACLAVIAVGSLYLLVRVFNQESVRRRLNSEAENRKNQDAILRLLNEMSDLADGDLTVRASVTEDLTGAIADSINYTIEELRTLIGGINRAASQVDGSAGQAQAIANELLQAAERQSQEIEQTSSNVERMARSIQGVSANAAESAQVAKTSLEAAEQGAEAVNNQIKGMGEIREQIQETAKRIKRLGESSQEIGEIVELISDITEQTNVLALNAAIQAAAAGEAGRGFSVVAEEVQRLAERSAEATKQIGAIVKTIQTDTHDAVAAMELSTQGVVEGAKLSDAAGTALTEIGRVSKELARLIEGIAHETEAQTDLASRVTQAMREILAITQQTTTGTKQSAESVGKISGLTSELKASVSGFKLS
ncbi:type IV pili methyl-accepting chemotaxis transducer N-terminal domain-containing protein [Chitinilyticum litopenaei]|uniref:Type IV pili methyl-accepting chemotaxis transducer N-terminal domain-containing protein n=1 Tax=Chitinilyticum piscinae TaxID=2866724 RepID=A0A8J7FN49_9NEIS|nr:type IV pili methyl-accepting chemotaxis transducer N-terminal domain-containing protein [Chitinilyticum piscinae]